MIFATRAGRRIMGIVVCIIETGRDPSLLEAGSPHERNAMRGATCPRMSLRSSGQHLLKLFVHEARE